jgi:hypothetical protein
MQTIFSDDRVALQTTAACDSAESCAPALDLVTKTPPRPSLPLLPDPTVFDPVHPAPRGGAFIFHPDDPVRRFDPATLASIVIETKASQLGWVGAASSELQAAGPGYVIRYAAADIYYSPETGAHEVHGDIRAKYNAYGAANGVLGLPTTDESKTPDQGGRYNHFQAGSIYWTPNTGPMVVRGAVRNLWAGRGWEQNPAFGYPIADVLTRGGESWGAFQNGGIYSANGVPEEALVVEIQPSDLTTVIRKMFDRRLKAADEDMGIQGGVATLNISNWGYGFWESTPRTITCGIDGFYSAGIPLVADPTFHLELTFQFELLWRKSATTEPPAANCASLRSTVANLEAQLRAVDKFLNEPIDGEPHPPKPVLNPEWKKLNQRVLDARHLLTACENSNTTSALTMSNVTKTLVIYLRQWHISTAGAFHERLQEGLVRNIPDAFPLAVKEIPPEARLMDVLLTPAGALKFLLAPQPFGEIVRAKFENDLNFFIENL